MSMKGKGGKGGKAKGGGKSHSAGETIEITKTKARATTGINEAILTLREALFTPTGKDRDVTEGIAPMFLKYDRKGLDCTVQFASKLSKDELTWAFGRIKEEMEARYDESGYGWDDDDKLEQLRAPEGRFLIVREALPPAEAAKPAAATTTEAAEGPKEVSKREAKKAARGTAAAVASKTQKGPLVAVAHFCFSVQGEYVDTMAGSPSLILWNVVIDAGSRRKGLGRHLLVLLELIARRSRMRFLSLPVVNGDDATRDWVLRGGKGFGMDTSLEALVDFDAQEEGFQVYCKELVAPQAPPAAAASTPAAAASAPVAATTGNAGKEKEEEKQEGEVKKDEVN